MLLDKESVLVQAAITKHRSPSGLNNRIFFYLFIFFHGSGDWRIEIMVVPVCSGSGESSRPGL